jgi:hypothetical protein
VSSYRGVDWHGVATTVAVVVAAWLLARLSNRLAAFTVARYERRQEETSPSQSAVLSLKRHETAVSVVRTTIRFAALSIAVIAVLGLVTGAGHTVTFAWASIAAVLVGFALQRFLTDILSGIFMISEGWLVVGESVVIEPAKLEGVVEEVSLRAVRLRALNGEVLRVHNSEITALRQRPRGVLEVRIELFVRDADAGRQLIEDIARIVPAGATDFVRLPAVDSVARLDDDLHHIVVRASVVAGRGWLAHELLPDLLRERAPDGLIVHGPVVVEIDEVAARRVARSMGRAYADRGP